VRSPENEQGASRVLKVDEKVLAYSIKMINYVTGMHKNFSHLAKAAQNSSSTI
jgi:hypothetical protein